MKSVYQVQTHKGIISSHDNYDDAVSAAYEYAGQDAVVGHAGDLSDGGDHTLVWATEEDSRDDDGAKAIIVIYED